MKMTDGLFLDARRVTPLPDINYEEMIVDAAAMHLVTRPRASVFDGEPLRRHL